MNKYILLLLFSFGLFYSCSDSELITPGDELILPPDPGTITAVIDDVVYDFSENTMVFSNDEYTNLEGENIEAQSISITFPGEISERAYHQGQGAVVTLMMGGGTAGIYVNMGQTGQLLPFVIRITKIDMANRVVSGIFEGKVRNISTGEELEIKNGAFTELPLVLQEGGDGILEAMFNNTLLEFNEGAEAVKNPNSFMISGQNPQLQQLRLTVPEPLEEETYTEANELVISVSLGTTGNPNEVYTNFDQENEEYLPARLVVVEITEEIGGTKRLKGIFSGKIKKFNSPIDEEIEITNGVIDVKLTP